MLTYSPAKPPRSWLPTSLVSCWHGRRDGVWILQAWRWHQGVEVSAEFSSDTRTLTNGSYSELAREKMWARIHLIPLLQAEEDRDQVRRYYADKEREKELLGAETKVYNSDRCVALLRYAIGLPLCHSGFGTSFLRSCGPLMREFCTGSYGQHTRSHLRSRKTRGLQGLQAFLATRLPFHVCRFTCSESNTFHDIRRNRRLHNVVYN